jgi:hypothetical protein
LREEEINRERKKKKEGGGGEGGGDTIKSISQGLKLKEKYSILYLIGKVLNCSGSFLLCV